MASGPAWYLTYRRLYRGGVAPETYRLNVTLDAEHAERLRRLAERTHVQESTLAGFLLCSALDEADPDVRDVSRLLDRSDGAHERAQRGLAEARTGRTIPLDCL